MQFEIYNYLIKFNINILNKTINFYFKREKQLNILLIIFKLYFLIYIIYISYN